MLYYFYNLYKSDENTIKSSHNISIIKGAAVFKIKSRIEWLSHNWYLAKYFTKVKYYQIYTYVLIISKDKQHKQKMRYHRTIYRQLVI